MNKITTAALAGLVAVTASADASMSRWAGFGVAQDFIADVQDIWTLPGVVASHKNTTYFELGKNAVNPTQAGATFSNGLAGATNAWGGVHTEVGPGVLGIWFNRPYNEGDNIITTGLGTPSLNPTGAAANTAFLAPQQTIDLVYGFGLSENSTLGIAINRASNNLKTETTNNAGTTVTEQSSGDLGFGLGLEQKGVGPIALLEVGLTFNTRGDVNTNNNGTVTNKNKQDGTDIDLRVGGDLAGDDGAFGRFEVQLQMDSRTRKTEPAATPAANSFVESKSSATVWKLGYAMGKSSDKGMGLFGLMLNGKNASRDEANNGGNAVNKAEWSNLNLVASTAGEAKVKEWLSIRAGLSSSLFYSGSAKTEVGTSANPTKTTTSTDNVTQAVASGGQAATSNATASFGTSLSLGSLVIDGVLNQDLFYTGTYLVSGVPAGLSTQVSATWAW